MRSDFTHFFRYDLTLAHSRDLNLNLCNRWVFLIKDRTKSALLNHFVINRSFQRVETGFGALEFFLRAVLRYLLILYKRPNPNDEYLKRIENRHCDCIGSLVG